MRITSLVAAKNNVPPIRHVGAASFLTPDKPLRFIVGEALKTLFTMDD
jgi:hypothetical protein